MNLKFRTTGIPRAIIRRILLLVAVFFACLALFTFLINYKGRQSTTDMAAPTLPTVSMTAGGREVSALRAYTVEMDACYMRDTVFPLDDTRVVPIHIHTYGAKISDVSYEIRSLDTRRKIAETKISDLKDEGNGLISAAPELENLIEGGDEYLFVLNMKADGRKLCFYTRVTMPVNAHADAIAAFAEDFSTKAQNGDENALATYVEPAPQGDEGTTVGDLSSVSIHSPVSDVCWSGFSGTRKGDVTFEWNDISDNYCALTMTYNMTDDAGNFYDVSEYFKVRYGTERMFLLDYQRDMTERFIPDRSRVRDNTLSVGVVPATFAVRSNENGRIAAFVQAGELFEYDESTGVFMTLFSFGGGVYGSEADVRTRWPEHEIKILSIDETGTVDFVVYGYMNAGRHEGQCGIDVMRYDATTGNTSEQAFIQSEKSFQILNANFSELIYKSSTDDFYIMAEGSLVHVNLATMAIDTIAYGLSESEYAVSESRRYVALDGGAAGKKAGTVILLDLESGDRQTLQPEADELLRPAAFMEDDLVYGKVRVGDVTETSVGSAIYPMYELDIVSMASKGQDVLMTYAKPGLYVTRIEKADAALTLTRVTKGADGSLVPAEGDTIRNSEGEVNRAISLTKKAVEGKGLSSELVLAKTDGDGASAVSASRTAPLALLESSKDIDLNIDVSDVAEQYFVYVGSRVVVATRDVTEAIARADAEMGIVIDNTQTYIWKRGLPNTGNAGKKLAPATNATSRGRALSAILAAEGENIDVDDLLSQGQSVSAVMAAALSDARVLNLTGTTLQEALYFVSRGTPVYAELDGEAVIIASYDANNISLYDAKTGDSRKMGRNDAAAAFAAGGNVFITYIRPE